MPHVAVPHVAVLHAAMRFFLCDLVSIFDIMLLGADGGLGDMSVSLLWPRQRALRLRPNRGSSRQTQPLGGPSDRGSADLGHRGGGVTQTRCCLGGQGVSLSFAAMQSRGFGEL